MKGGRDSEGERAGDAWSVGQGDQRDGAAAGEPRRIDVQELFGGRRELILLHRGAEYLLRLTSNDKLILTK